MPHYHVKYGKNTNNIIEIEYRVLTNNLDLLHIQLPAWRPGRYELGNFAQYMFTLSAQNEKGEVVVCRKITKDRWTVITKNAKEILFRYQYAAVIKNAGGTFKTPSQLVLTPVNCLVYVEELINEPCSISLDIPVDFNLASAVETTMAVNSYYELAASPIVCSKNIQRITYQVENTNFHICIEGEVTPNFENLTKDFTKFTQGLVNDFKGFTEADYYFLILIFDEKHYHGVEHLNSTLIALGPNTDYLNHDFYLNLLGVSSHELYHFWNICRIRPVEMMPYDYSKENYFETGYVAEGVTTYYGDYILGKTKTITEDECLKELSKTITRHLNNPGKLEASLTNSSLELWLDGYKKGVHGRKVSIYAKGATIAMILDLWIRKVTENKKALKDVMLLLWQNHGKTQIGYSTQDYKNYIEEVTNQSVEWYFDDFVFGTKPIDSLLKSLTKSFGLNILEEQTKEKNLIDYVLTKVENPTEEQLTNYSNWMCNETNN